MTETDYEGLNEAFGKAEEYFLARYKEVGARVPMSSNWILIWDHYKGVLQVQKSDEDPILIASSPLSVRIEAAPHLKNLEQICLGQIHERTSKVQKAIASINSFLGVR